MHPALLTFDLEDWHQLVGRMFGYTPDAAMRDRLKVQVDGILRLLDRWQVKATFFVLGITAESSPGVVKEVADAGHEIASHGYAHRSVRSHGAEDFARDLDAAATAVEAATGRRPRGFRAPAFSIDERSFWAFDVLLDRGFTYDSSIFPFRGRRYGVPGFDTAPGPVHAPSGRSLLEIPLAVTDVGPVRLPVAGGGYWRALPGPVLRRAVRRIARDAPPVLYFHPAEFDPQRLSPPRLSPALRRFAAAQNVRRTSVPGKLADLFRVHRCVSVSDYLEGR
ncbi:MAG: polysaccharide deacetylase family protein [Actinomycetota bacterium]